jgi:hypothetical protein
MANIPAMVEKRKKTKIGEKKYPFHEPIRRQHSDIRWNYHQNKIGKINICA